MISKISKPYRALLTLITIFFLYSCATAELTPDQLAVRAGNVDAIKEQIEQGLDVNAVGGNGYTPLQVAAAFGEFEVMGYLLDNGANPGVHKTVDHDQLSAPPLWHIALRSNPLYGEEHNNKARTLAERMVKMGADPDFLYREAKGLVLGNGGTSTSARMKAPNWPWDIWVREYREQQQSRSHQMAQAEEESRQLLRRQREQQIWDRDHTLPEDIRKDKYMITLTEHLKYERWEQALIYFNLLQRLNVPISPSSSFFWGEALMKTDNQLEGLDKLYDYVLQEGKNGEHYIAALTLISEVTEAILESESLQDSAKDHRPAEVVLYRIKHFGGGGISTRFEIDGHSVGQLRSGYFEIEVRPGRHELKVGNITIFSDSVSDHTIEVRTADFKPGHRYWFSYDIHRSPAFRQEHSESRVRSDLAKLARLTPDLDHIDDVLVSDAEKNDFTRCERQRTKEECRNYLDHYPHGTFSVQAKLIFNEHDRAIKDKLLRRDGDLPLSIKNDRYMVALTNHLKNHRYHEALPYFDKLRQIGVQLSPEFTYREGLALLRVGNQAAARQKLYEYIDIAGKNGKYYLQALKSISEAEAAL